MKGFREVCHGIPLYLLIAEIVLSFGAAMSIGMTGFYFAKKFRVQSNALGTINGVTNLAMAGLTLLIPKVSARVGYPIVAYIALCSTSIPLLIAITYAPTLDVAANIYIIRTVLMNVASPLYAAFTMKVVDSSVRGKMSSALILVSVGGRMIGSLVGGWLMDIDIDSPFRATAIVYTLYLALLYLLIVKKNSGKAISYRV